MRIPTRSLAGITVLALLVPLAAACGGSGNGEGEGGETPLIAFRDPASQVSISYPSTWQKTSDQPLTFTGVDEYISLEIRPLTGGDVLAAAKTDEASLSTANSGYKTVGTIVASKEVKNAAVISYEWNLAKSAVTGKPVHQRADRYYINLGDGRVALLTGSSPKTTFDREQVRDIALALKVTK